MMFVPESKEVLRESVEDLQNAVMLAEASGETGVALDVFTSKFLQGGLYLTQCATVFLYDLIQWAREEGLDPEFLSFQESLFATDEEDEEDDDDDDDDEDDEDEDDGGVAVLDHDTKPDDEMTSNILNTLLQDFINNDAAHFNEVVKNSYFYGFKETAYWFLTLVSIYNHLIGEIDG